MGTLVGTNYVHGEVRVSALVHLVGVIQRKGDIALVPTYCACVIESQVHAVGNAIDKKLLSTINKILIDKLSIRSFCY